jgi:hypothetical protein
MCEPASIMTAVSVGSTIAGTAASVVSAGSQVAGSLHAGEMKSGIASANARLFDEQAKARIEKGKFDAQTAMRNYSRAKGTALSRIASSGVSAQSFYDVLADDAAEAALQRKAIKYGAQAEADNLRFQAAGQRLEARAAKDGARIAAIGNAASGVSDFAASFKSPFAAEETIPPWITSFYPAG